MIYIVRSGKSNRTEVICTEVNSYNRETILIPEDTVMNWAFVIVESCPQVSQERPF